MKNETVEVDLDTILASADPPRSGWIRFGRGVGATVLAVSTVAACGTYAWGMNELFNQRKYLERIGDKVLDPQPVPTASMVPTVDPSYIEQPTIGSLNPSPTPSETSSSDLPDDPKLRKIMKRNEKVMRERVEYCLDRIAAGHKTC